MKTLKTLTKVVSLLLLFTGCGPKPEMTEGYVIYGKIVGIDEGKVVLAKLDLVTNERVFVDSAEIRDGAFTLEGKVESPYLHTLFINNDQDKVHFFLENSEIGITGKINDLEKTSITGSREDSLFHSYKEDDIFDREMGMYIMLNYPDYCFSAFTAYYQFQIHNIDLDTMDMIMHGFSEAVKGSTYYEHLNKLYTTIKKVAISQPAPAFSIPDTSGHIVKLEDFLGKYVLIDFWASWCPPCRAANPELVKVYEQYADRNFTIVGISVDEDELLWKNAIEADRLPWINLSNVNGWGGITETYGIKAVPQNFLLDPDGIIIEKNIEPKQLSEILNKTLPL